MEEHVVMKHTVEHLIVSHLGAYMSITNAKTITLDDANEQASTIRHLLSRDNIGVTVVELIARPDENELYVVFDTYTTLAHERTLQGDSDAIDEAEARIRTVMDRATDEQTIVDYTLYGSNRCRPLV